ncbi:hypothetical protein, partial [Mesorhizobium sp. M7A.F.Ca.AU.002.02.1.1]|uniref:hypothetical protein n=1 Tax=Mesorhizobium sp. M7A.F.Ca.AU.002.02.1.1 TaxID=2496671 RepID=UPI0019D20506
VLQGRHHDAARRRQEDDRRDRQSHGSLIRDKRRDTPRIARLRAGLFLGRLSWLDGDFGATMTNSRLDGGIVVDGDVGA